MTTTIVYLLRNAQSIPREDMPQSEWPLSQEGQRQASLLAKVFEHEGIDKIVSSPYARAKDSVAPYAAQFGLDVEENQNFRDQVVSPDFLAPLDFQELMREMWQDFNYAVAGGEPNSRCQTRVLNEIKQTVDKHAGHKVLISTHGQPISLILKHFDSMIGVDDWAKMGMPDLYRFEYNDDQGIWDRSFKCPEI